MEKTRYPCNNGYKVGCTLPFPEDKRPLLPCVQEEQIRNIINERMKKVSN